MSVHSPAFIGRLKPGRRPPSENCLGADGERRLHERPREADPSFALVHPGAGGLQDAAGALGVDPHAGPREDGQRLLVDPRDLGVGQDAQEGRHRGDSGSWQGTPVVTDAGWRDATTGHRRR